MTRAALLMPDGMELQALWCRQCCYQASAKQSNPLNDEQKPELLLNLHLLFMYTTAFFRQLSGPEQIQDERNQ